MKNFWFVIKVVENIRETLENEFKRVFDELVSGSDPILRKSNVADFQVNGCFQLSKVLKKTPFEVAQMVISRLTLTDLIDVSVDPKGFINIFISNDYLLTVLNKMIRDPRLGVRLVKKERIVIDYSSPNVAKEMHVGHLRSTVIGDALMRMLTFVGHDVIKENHIGDWGTPFGMLIQYLKEEGLERLNQLELGELDKFYKQAREKFDTSDEFQKKSRENVVALQQGEPQTVKLWKMLVDKSTSYFQSIYDKLSVDLTKDDIKGESYYKSLIPHVIDELAKKSLLVEDQNTLCVFPEGFYNKQGNPLPLILVKSDGGYTYAATDLAAIYDRVFNIKAQKVLYVVGLPQSEHLSMCFKVASMVGWTDGVELVHVGFGSVLGVDKKMLRTRSGEPIKLASLIQEAIERAQAEVQKRYGNSYVTDISPEHIAIGAIKYADLSTERIRDYIYDPDKMISFEGNTGPYLQYAHARIASVLRKAKELGNLEFGGSLNNFERDLAVQVIGFEDAISSTLATYEPHKLCNYLYSVASSFSRFYENCPILKSPEDVKQNRLAISVITKNVLNKGLELLGIYAPEKM